MIGIIQQFNLSTFWPCIGAPPIGDHTGEGAGGESRPFRAAGGSLGQFQ